MTRFTSYSTCMTCPTMTQVPKEQNCIIQSEIILFFFMFFCMNHGHFIRYFHHDYHSFSITIHIKELFMLFFINLTSFHYSLFLVSKQELTTLLNHVPKELFHSPSVHSIRRWKPGKPGKYLHYRVLFYNHFLNATFHVVISLLPSTSYVLTLPFVSLCFSSHHSPSLFPLFCLSPVSLVF